MENPFSDVGFKDELVGAELFKTVNAGFSPILPGDFSKLRDIAEYLNEHPDPVGVINKAKYKKSSSMTPLDFIHSYVSLDKERMMHAQKVSEYEKQLKYYG